MRGRLAGGGAPAAQHAAWLYGNLATSAYTPELDVAPLPLGAVARALRRTVDRCGCVAGRGSTLWSPQRSRRPVGHPARWACLGWPPKGGLSPLLPPWQRRRQVRCRRGARGGGAGGRRALRRLCHPPHAAHRGGGLPACLGCSGRGLAAAQSWQQCSAGMAGWLLRDGCPVDSRGTAGPWAALPAQCLPACRTHLPPPTTPSQIPLPTPQLQAAAAGRPAPIMVSQCWLDYAADADFAGQLPLAAVPTFGRLAVPVAHSQPAPPAAGGGVLVHLWLPQDQARELAAAATQAAATAAPGRQDA